MIVAIYALWRGLRLGRRAVPYLVWVGGGLLLAVALGAVQWLPGIAAVSTSQRAPQRLSLRVRIAARPMARTGARSRPPGRIGIVRTAWLPGQLQPPRGDQLRRSYAARRFIRIARPAAVAASCAGVARLARDGAGRDGPGSRGLYPSLAPAHPGALLRRRASPEPQHPHRRHGLRLSPRLLGRCLVGRRKGATGRSSRTGSGGGTGIHRADDATGAIGLRRWIGVLGGGPGCSERCPGC